MTSARAFLGEGVFVPIPGGEEYGVLVTQCLMDILVEDVGLGEGPDMASFCFAGVWALTVGFLRENVGVLVERGRSPV